MNMEAVSEAEVKFYKTLQSKIKLVLQYEDLNLLKYAVDMIPTEELHVKATLKLSAIGQDDIGFEDMLLLELLNWFKCSFFTWVDKPKCEACGELPEERGVVSPNKSESMWNASAVELYFCTKCQIYVRFPRYYQPKKLLETRRGRCGEWANCFTLLCRALGYDARFVYDWNDHVWTEVYSFAKNRWLHCDPCENVCDKPLLYEIGWKKPISYVLAFSKDEVQDVTWRYTSNFREAMRRRNLCREEWLLHCILRFITKLQANLSPERKYELSERRAIELSEFLSEPKVDGFYGDRTSGSMAWKIARGEAHLNPNQTAYVFKLTDKEVSMKNFHIKYSCALDKYVRVSDQCTESENWTACTFNYDNIFRKVEPDWKQAYLARTEKSDKGLISWKFNFNNSGLAIQTLKVHLRSATFENGNINWFIVSDSGPVVSKKYAADDVISLLTQDFKGCTSLTISAELMYGTGVTAWQHTQLFRQALDSNEYPFEVNISLSEL